MSTDKIISLNVLATIRLEKSTLLLLENDILKIEIHEKSEVLAEDIFAIQKPKLELTKNKPHCVLFVMPRFGNVNKEGREFSASAEANVNAIAKAIIAPNLGMRIIANFFISRNKPLIPHKIFLQQEEGIKWLLEQKKQFYQTRNEKVDSCE